VRPTPPSDALSGVRATGRSDSSVSLNAPRPQVAPIRSESTPNLTVPRPQPDAERAVLDRNFAFFLLFFFSFYFSCFFFF
jgi:hypothetical protein